LWGRGRGAGPGGAPAAAQRRGRTTWKRDEAPAGWNGCREGEDPGPGGCARAGSGSRVHFSIAASTGGPGGMGGLRSGGATQSGALNRGQRLAGACRGEGLVGGEHGPDRLSQPPARSTWATLGPRWRPSRVLVRR